jgi:2-polyprenyl-6-methoxyphenol hydroxylase-like FAD-dependent oxidoreductase
MQAIDSAAASRFLDNVIPMRGRMIHDSNGNLDSQPYDRDGQVGTVFPLLDDSRAHALVPRLSPPLNRLVLEKCINSVDRALLNQGLLNEALAVRSIRVFFQHKVVSIDFDGRVISVLATTGKEIQRGFDLCIGADGSYSIVRRQLMRVVRWVPLPISERCVMTKNVSSSVAWIFSKNISLMNILNLEYQLDETIVIIQFFYLIRIICISGQGTLSCS